MKIALVCPYDFSRPGGVKSHIVVLSKYLRKSGHEVIIIAPSKNVQPLGEDHVQFFGKNRSLNLWGTKIDINIALGRERKTLREFIGKENFDIIHFHTFWNPVLPWQIRRFSQAKHVVTFHDTPKNRFVGRTIMPIAALGMFKLMDAIISVSETQASYINRLSKREISIIPNGIDLDEYLKPVEPIEKYLDGKFNLLFLGRLEERKGLIYAMKSYKALKQKNEGLRLIIAGDGDERSVAEAFIRKHSLPDVHLLGFVSEEMKLQLLKTADTFLTPALFGESFGIVLLEAMAMGVPVTGFANEGYLNVLSDEQQKYFATPGDLDGLIGRIQFMINSKPILKSLSEQGQKVVKAYDWKEIIAQIETIYNNAAR